MKTEADIPWRTLSEDPLDGSLLSTRIRTRLIHIIHIVQKKTNDQNQFKQKNKHIIYVPLNFHLSRSLGSGAVDLRHTCNTTQILNVYMFKSFTSNIQRITICVFISICLVCIRCMCSVSDMIIRYANISTNQKGSTKSVREGTKKNLPDRCCWRCKKRFNWLNMPERFYWIHTTDMRVS